MIICLRDLYVNSTCAHVLPPLQLLAANEEPQEHTMAPSDAAQLEQAQKMDVHTVIGGRSTTDSIFGMYDLKSSRKNESAVRSPNQAHTQGMPFDKATHKDTQLAHSITSPVQFRRTAFCLRRWSATPHTQASRTSGHGRAAPASTSSKAWCTTQVQGASRLTT